MSCPLLASGKEGGRVLNAKLEPKGKRHSSRSTRRLVLIGKGLGHKVSIADCREPNGSTVSSRTCADSCAAGVFGTGGYLLGEGIRRIAGPVGWAFLALAVVFGFVFWRYYKKRRRPVGQGRTRDGARGLAGVAIFSQKAASATRAWNFCFATVFDERLVMCGRFCVRSDGDFASRVHGRG
jgi:hypothetical protein